MPPRRSFCLKAARRQKIQPNKETNLMRTKAILAGLLVAASAQAYAAYPGQPIKIVVGYAAGGTTDLLARALGEQLSTELNVPVVIENKAGAAGSIAA